MGKIAYIQAAWHTEITNPAKEAFLTQICKRGYTAADVEFFSAPGALEIPLMAKKLAKTGKYVAVACSGLVVDGGIYRHDFVAHAVLQGIVNASLQTEVPILSAVLTPHQYHEHSTHAEFFKQHMAVKGTELANACADIVTGLAAIG